MTDYMVQGLTRRRSELAGRVLNLQKEMAAISADIEHLDAVIKLVAPELNIPDIAPKVHVPPADWSKRGEMSRRVFAILRVAQTPLTARQIATQLIVERGMASTPLLLSRITKRVSGCLRDRREQGLVRNVGGGDSMWLLWELVR